MLHLYPAEFRFIHIAPSYPGGQRTSECACIFFVCYPCESTESRSYRTCSLWSATCLYYAIAYELMRFIEIKSGNRCG